jgi:hypothetical protein
MKREYFSSFKQDRRFNEPRSGTCTALVDARFLIWLAQQSAHGAVGESLNRQGLMGLLSQAMAQAGLDVDLRRIYWYTDRADGLFLDDQIVRWVQAHDVDGGASMLRALGQDLAQLAQQHACDHVLIATDDERFLSDIDAAQLTGLSVHLLADESARNMPQMMRSDPGWGRVLAQADRRVVVNAQALAEMLQGKIPVGMNAAFNAPIENLDEVRQTITEVITAWWDEEPEDLREDLRDALQVSRGVPQEVDRQLLLRMRQRLTRALSLNEKKLLREVLRTVVMGPAAATTTPVTAAHAGGLPVAIED